MITDPEWRVGRVRLAIWILIVLMVLSSAAAGLLLHSSFRSRPGGRRRHPPHLVVWVVAQLLGRIVR
jgi:hypothetical protein